MKNKLLCVAHRGLSLWSSSGFLISSRHIAVAAVIALSPNLTAVHASTITGTLSNFDIYNSTPEPTEGAEIELEDIHPSDIGGSYPSHYDVKTITEYNDSLGNFAGTRITFTGYNFNPAINNGSLDPVSIPLNTNGHTCVNTEGCEHFGFWIKGGVQPTAKRFFWLNDNNGTFERIGTMPETIPGPTWNINPVNNILEVGIEVPEPAEVVVQRPDSTWMKVFKVKFGSDFAPNSLEEMQILLEDLTSGNAIVPEDVAEVETEWELLEGGKAPKVKEEQIENADRLIIRRYEFYEYTGPVTAENEPDSILLDQDNIDPSNVDGMGLSFLGNFLSANMVGAVLNPVPEPSSCGLLLAGLALTSLWRPTRQRSRR